MFFLYQVATARNKEGETSLAFLVNNFRWIKFTANQKLQLTKYGNLLFGQEATFSTRREATTQPQASQAPEDEHIMTEINITGVADPAMLESNLLAQLDDISSSFRSIVDTLTALERRCSSTEGQQQPQQQQQQRQQIAPEDAEDKVKTAPSEASTGETAATASEKPTVTPDLMGFAPLIISDDVSSDSLPVLIQLTQNWPSVASTILGFYPVESTDVPMPQEPSDSTSSSQTSSSRSKLLESCSLDSFVFELLSHADEAVLVSFVETIINEMNKHSKYLTMDAVHRSSELNSAADPKDVPLVVGVRFLRSVIRQLAVHLSRSGLSYVDLRTRLGSSPSASNVRNSQSDNMEFKRKVRLVP